MRHVYLLSLGLLLALTENILVQTTCGPGYMKHKGKCADEDECKSDPLVCGKNATCFNTDGSYYCQCHGGFTPTHNFTQMDSIECEDINECVDGSADCGSNAECKNSEGGYNCTCATGYISSNGKEIFNAGQGVQCTDINECVDGRADCSSNAECVNSEGGYNCTCATGYISSNGKEIFNAGQGVQCIDRNERDDPSFCGKYATCRNTAGSFYCICDAGFRLKSGETNFTDTNQLCESVCEIDKSICGGGVCKNNKDGHECVCSSVLANYEHKQMKCTDLKCDRLLSKSDASQVAPELRKLVSLMTSSCLVLSQSESVRNNTQVDGEKLLKAFLSDLDDLLPGGFNGDNDIVSALLRIVAIILKLIGHLLSASRTRQKSTKTDVELLVNRGSSPPEGHFMMNISGAQFTSHWDTATGNTYLGFTSAALLSYKGLDESLNCCYKHLQTQQKQTFKINSKVVTATFINYETANLKKPVNLTFSHLKKNNEKHICVFWDPELEGGAWSTHGCTTVRSSADQTACSCYKLGSFAVMTALCDTGVCRPTLNFCQKGSKS